MKGDAAGAVSARGARNLRVALTAGANALRANGNFGQTGDVLEFTLEAKRLAELDPRLEGALHAAGRLSGTLEQPGIDLAINATAFGLKERPRLETLRARLNGTAQRHVLTVQGRSQPFDFEGRVEGSWVAPRWTGSLASFENKGAYPAAIAAPVPVSFDGARLAAGPGEARVAGGRVSLQALVWSKGRLDTQGELAGMPLAPFLALAGVPALSTDLRLGGRWNLATTTRLNGTIALARETGDVVLGGAVPLPLHLERLQLEARVVDDAVDGTLEVSGSTINGRVRLAAASLARDAALKADGSFEAATLKIIAPLLGTRAVVDGRATLALAAAGTVGAPLFTGSLAATGLRIESPLYGVRLRDGTLRAELAPDALRLSELSVRGGDGTLTATGTMARGAKASTTVDWRAEGLQVFDRPDLRLNVDGKGTIGHRRRPHGRARSPRCPPGLLRVREGGRAQARERRGGGRPSGARHTGIGAPALRGEAARPRRRARFRRAHPHSGRRPRYHALREAAPASPPVRD